MGKRWFWQDGPEDTDVCYEISYLEDGEEHAVPVAMVYTREDAEKFISAIRWYETFEAGKFALPAKVTTPKKTAKPVAKKATTKARK